MSQVVAYKRLKTVENHLPSGPKCGRGHLGGVYMTPGRLSPRSEFTPVLVPGREFHSGTKSRNGIM